MGCKALVVFEMKNPGIFQYLAVSNSQLIYLLKALSPERGQEVAKECHGFDWIMAKY